LPTLPIRSTAFADLYGDVTSALERHIREQESLGALTALDAAWFRALISGFQTEYLKWPAYRGTHLGEYLQLFENERIDPILRLASHAFLHVTYDLPRVIADTLAGTTGPGRLVKRTVFLRPGPIFLREFMAHARTGKLGLLARLMGRMESARVLAYWVLALRSIGWVHAEVLADSTQRPTIEGRMAQALLVAGRYAASTGNVRGIPDLNNSELVALLPLLTAPGWAAPPSRLWPAVAAFFSWVATWLTFSQRKVRSPLSARVDALGIATHRLMVRAMDPTLEMPMLIESRDNE
jgi:hypothetical protein